MVESGVGVPRRTDGHDGKVEVIDGVGGDRGGDGVLLPILIRLHNQDSSHNEPKTNNQNPKNLCCLGLEEKYWKEKKLQKNLPQLKIYELDHVW